ncbi:MAG: DUF4920 domain-containing protein [Bacteroidota bacterium]
MKFGVSRFLLATLCVMIVHLSSAQEYFGKYGAEISADGAEQVTSLDLESMQSSDAPIKLEGEIESTCVVKGCWMRIKDADGGSMMVRFKDYGFFVPTEGVEGKRAIFEGELFKQEVSVEELRHYAEDAGKSKEEIAAITKPVVEYAFVADGVIIK